MDGNSLSQRRPGRLWRVERGFSTIELLIVMAIGLVVTGIALVSIAPSVKKSKSDIARELVLGEMRRAHERAIDERRIYRVTFVAPRTILVEVGTPANLKARISGIASAGFAQAQAPLDLPQSIQFSVVSGIPTAAGAVPDGFGTGTNPIDFDVNNGGSAIEIYFQPDGRALDAFNRLNDGVVYIADPNELLSSRAVSLYGSTGRVKGWYLAQDTAGAYRWTQ